MYLLARKTRFLEKQTVDRETEAALERKGRKSGPGDGGMVAKVVSNKLYRNFLKSQELDCRITLREAGRDGIMSDVRNRYKRRGEEGV